MFSFSLLWPLLPPPPRHSFFEFSSHSFLLKCFRQPAACVPLLPCLSPRPCPLYIACLCQPSYLSPCLLRWSLPHLCLCQPSPCLLRWSLSHLSRCRPCLQCRWRPDWFQLVLPCLLVRPCLLRLLLQWDGACAYYLPPSPRRILQPKIAILFSVGLAGEHLQTNNLPPRNLQ